MQMGAEVGVVWLQGDGLADDEDGAFCVAQSVMQFGEGVQVRGRVGAQAQGSPGQANALAQVNPLNRVEPREVVQAAVVEGIEFEGFFEVFLCAFIVLVLVVHIAQFAVSTGVEFGFTVGLRFNRQHLSV